MGPKKRTSANTVARTPRVHSMRERRAVVIKERRLRQLTLRLRSPQGVNDCEVFEELRTLALEPHGFVSDELRRRLWPYLLGVDTEIAVVNKEHVAHYTRRNAPHRDDSQVEKDIDRSLWNYDVVTGIREAERKGKRKQLTQVINAVVNDNPELYYYQGFHDVCSVFLLVLRDQLAFHVVKSVSATYHREAMRKNFESVLHATRLLYPLIETEDPELFAHLRESGVEPFFAFSWMITWFAHHLDRLADVSRLYDVLMLSHPLFILYISAAVVLEARQRVLKAECDFGVLHGLLSKLPKTMDVEAVISRGSIIFHRFPVDDLLTYSEHQFELRESQYCQFPFSFQRRFQTIDEPYLPLGVYKKPKRTDEKATTTTAWQVCGNQQQLLVGYLSVA